MEYTIKKLAQLSGVSTRTLRFYDSENLLKPLRINSSRYRIYGKDEADRLQIILFYKELGFSIDEIKSIINNKNTDIVHILNDQLSRLEKQKVHFENLIKTVKNTIRYKKGGIIMSDKEKFESFKRDLVEKNEKTYGNEIREKYGEEAINKSNEKMMNLSEEDFNKMNEISAKLNLLLEECVKNNLESTGEKGIEAAKLHKEWLSYPWAHYSKEAHLGLVNMYVEDERFTAYYDKNVKGCALFLKDAVENLLIIVES